MHGNIFGTCRRAMYQFIYKINKVCFVTCPNCLLWTASFCIFISNFVRVQMISTKTFDWSPVQIAGKINRFIREYGLRDIGQLEQDLVFGDAGAKEVISILRSKQVKRNKKTGLLLSPFQFDFILCLTCFFYQGYESRKQVEVADYIWNCISRKVWRWQRGKVDAGISQKKTPVLMIYWLYK